MSTKYNMVRDNNSNPGILGFGNPFALDGYIISLLNDTQTITVPNNYQEWIAIFSYSPNSIVWVDGITIGTFSMPGAGTHMESTAEMNPAGKYVKGGQSISFTTQTPGGAIVSVKFYEVGMKGN